MPKNMNICGTSVWELHEKTDISSYLRHGDAEAPVLHLLHGNGFSSGSLFALADAMPAAWTLMCSDIPGHGLTPVRGMAWPDWNAMADRLAQNVLKSFDHPVVGVGHSMGGVLTLLMAARYPDLFSRIILLDPVLFPSHILVGQRLVHKSGLWGKLPLVKKAMRRESCWNDVESMRASLQNKGLYRQWHPVALEGFCRTGSRITKAGVELACRPDWEGRIFGSAPRALWSSVRKLTMPTDILIADHGFDFIPAGVRRARRLNPIISSRLVGGSHCFPMEHPYETATVIKDILEA